MSLSDHPFCLLMFLLRANSRNINKQKGWPDRDTNRVYQVQWDLHTSYRFRERRGHFQELCMSAVSKISVLFCTKVRSMGVKIAVGL